MSRAGRVRIERKAASGHRARAYFLTVKFGKGAGYVDENGRRGATLRAGTIVRSYPAHGLRAETKRFRIRLSRNANAPRPFYPAWY